MNLSTVAIYLVLFFQTPVVTTHVQNHHLIHDYDKGMYYYVMKSDYAYRAQTKITNEGSCVQINHFDKGQASTVCFDQAYVLSPDIDMLYNVNDYKILIFKNLGVVIEYHAFNEADNIYTKMTIFYSGVYNEALISKELEKAHLFFDGVHRSLRKKRKKPTKRT